MGFPSRASWGAANAPGWWRSPLPQPPRNLCPTPHKGARSNGETTMLGNPPRQRQRWGRQRQSPHHPRLWENHKRSLIGGPRKTGGPGGRQHGERGRRAEVRPVAPPGASLASFWASRKKLAAASGEIPPPGAPGANPPGPDAVDSERGWDFPPAPPGAQPTLQGGGGHHLPRPTAELVPHPAQRRALKRRNHRTGKPTQAAAAVGEATSIPIPPAPLRCPAMPPNWRPP